MHDPSDLDPRDAGFLQRHLGLVLRELTDADDDLCVEQSHNVAEVLAAEAVQRLALDDWELGGSNVLGVVVHEDQRTDVVHEAVAEEVVRLATILLEESPEPTATDLKYMKYKL